jgi:HAD superfamily hydrolase (TIGR01549 family)
MAKVLCFDRIEDLAVPAWALHQKIGLDGKLLALAIGLELGRSINAERAIDLDQGHSKIMKELLPGAEALPGAIELLQDLRERKIPHGIATSSERDALRGLIGILRIPDETIIVCSNDVKAAKPEPDLFISCSESLGISALNCFAVGDAVWDMLAARHAGILSVGLLSGGMTEQNLVQAGANLSDLSGPCRLESTSV